MRFIGNKENSVEKIHKVLKDEKINDHSFFDFFAGTTSVGRYFKNHGTQILSSDLMYFSYVLQKAYIENNNEPIFEKLLSKITVNNNKLFITPLELVVSYLNELDGVEGFIYKIIRTVVLCGSDDEKTPVGEISLLLNNKGKIILSVRAPHIFKS